MARPRIRTPTSTPTRACCSSITASTTTTTTRCSLASVAPMVSLPSSSGTARLASRWSDPSQSLLSGSPTSSRRTPTDYSRLATSAPRRAGASARRSEMIETLHARGVAPKLHMAAARPRLWAARWSYTPSLGRRSRRVACEKPTVPVHGTIRMAMASVRERWAGTSMRTLRVLPLSPHSSCWPTSGTCLIGHHGSLPSRRHQVSDVGNG
mmetsp:Transcript_17226/g.52092  ORF Transcript_17226/g.52092 Transcript_17226/m.52092 type:complete len:210 (+) Transcript_17226:882-1511(+)